jgi:hypothetical protein
MHVTALFSAPAFLHVLCTNTMKNQNWLKSLRIWDAGFSLCIVYSTPVHSVLAFTLVLWQVVLCCLKVSLPKLELMHIPTCERYSDKGETSLYVCMWLRFVDGEPTAWNQVNIVGLHWTGYHPSFKLPGSWRANFYTGVAQLIGDSYSALFV